MQSLHSLMGKGTLKPNGSSLYPSPLDTGSLPVSGRSRSQQAEMESKYSSVHTLPRQTGVPYDHSVALVTGDINLESGFIPNTNVPLSDYRQFLIDELRTDELDGIVKHLWLAGLPAFKTRPLHGQRVVQREIAVCEQIGLHLVSFRGTIFVKPIPHFLLHHKFFSDHVANVPDFEPWAHGFLCSYLSLIVHQSDFTIAKQLGLLPSDATWADWLKMAAQLDSAFKKPGGNRVSFDNRYSFGELRLSRLNLIMQFIRFRLTRGYIWLDTQYSQYFVRYFALIVLLFAAYFSVMLSAFQLATGVGAKLGASELVQTAGFWFAISTLLVLGCTVVLPVVWLLVLLIIQYYYIKTAKEGAYERHLMFL